MVFWVTCEHLRNTSRMPSVRVSALPKNSGLILFFFNLSLPLFTGGVILYAGSSGSASPSPGSPSSGYQTQSPSSHSQPSSPEGVSFQEIGALKQRGEPGGGNPSPRMVFQFPEVNNAPVAQITTVSSATYNHPAVAKRHCGLTGTFTSKC